MRILVTGGCGFIGRNFIRLLQGERPQWQVVNLDALTYAATPGGLPDASDRYRFARGDVCDPEAVRAAMQGAQAVVHFAAESHVDRSILDSAPFVRTNVLGTQVLLDAARALGAETFVQVSTDEVYGALGPEDPPFTEAHPLDPRSPYAASKAAADHLALAYVRTYGLDVRITRCSNNYGPYQFPEKLIPLTLVNALQGQRIPVYGHGRQRRDWIHVEDHCRAILAVLERGRAGEAYNIGAQEERENLDVVRSVLAAAGASEDLISFVPDRPGHDARYAIDARKIRAALGWVPRYSLPLGIAETIAWYRQHERWWRPLLGDAYRSYYQRQYGTP